MRSKFLLAVVLAALPSFAFAETKVGGTYDVKGTNFDGSPYGGQAEIVASSNTTCRITWRTGGSTSQGFCMRDDYSLAAAYSLGNAIGLVIYQIESDGTLRGVWTIKDKSGAGTEVLTPR